MANENHLAILKKGVKMWNRWRKQSKAIPDLSYAKLVGASLAGIDFKDALLTGAKLRRADLSDYSDLRDCDLRRADLYRANLGSSSFLRADISDANLRGANLVNAKLRGANLSGSTFGFANLDFADLSGSNLAGADLNHADLISANLSNANVNHANLSNAKLHDTDFTCATLIEVDLYGASLNSAILVEANLWGVHLMDTDLTSANLSGADLQEAVTLHTLFVDCDLSGATGLDRVYHKGPSTVDIDTIYKSKGNISGAFLRGCGVPEGFITQMRSLVDAEDGIQFYSCFISFSTKDKEFADQLYDRMHDAHLRVWYAPQDMQGGKKLYEQIETAIRVYDKLLIVLSKASLRSEWVMKELRKAFETERRSGKRKLFPVRLTDYRTLKKWECHDSKSGKDLAEELRQYFIPDFSNWKDHDQFEKAFSRLLKDLRA
jgi:uncharacterized protein YjbI with pentapeptide repeats